MRAQIHSMVTNQGIGPTLSSLSLPPIQVNQDAGDMVATVNRMGKDKRNERNDTSLTDIRRLSGFLILEDTERDSSPR